MPDAPRPPVSEVVHSIALARQPALSGPQLPSVLGDWYTRHSRVETAPPYEIPPEAAEPAASLQAPRLQLMTAGPLPRYWLISDDEQELVQVQPDYLALNWRRRSDDDAYPGYTEMHNRFSGLLQETAEGLSRNRGTLKPIRAELTYINTIHPNNLWSSHRDTHRIIRISLPADASYESLGFSYSQSVAGPDGEWRGRLHVTLNPTIDWIKQEPQLVLNLTARSGDFSDQSIEATLEFMNLAHTAIEKTFNNLFSQEALQAWGLQ